MNTEAYLEWVNKAALCNPPTLRNSYALTQRVLAEQVPGDLVECGTFAGAQIAAMHRACVDAGQSRPIQAFDSFKGIPPAGEKDLEFQQVPAWRSACGLENFNKFMRQWGVRNVTTHEGMFDATVPQYAKQGRPIALLRLDGDLYDSTRVCLEHLYPLLSDGGFCIVDDYALSGCREAVHEYFGDDLPTFIAVEGGGGPVWFQK